MAGPCSYSKDSGRVTPESSKSIEDLIFQVLRPLIFAGKHAEALTFLSRVKDINRRTEVAAIAEEYSLQNTKIA